MQQLRETMPEDTMRHAAAIDPEEPLSTHKAAKLCGVCSSSVARWTTEHGLACYRTPGGHRRIVARDLVAFMQAWNIPTPFTLAS